jgi:hypothetical protein
MLTAGWQIFELAAEKEGEARNKPPVNKHSKNLTPKQDNWWTTELILEPEDNIQI